MPEYVISFESTHAAMAASKTLSAHNMRFMTVPVPTAISAGCGIALKFNSDDPSAVLDLLEQQEGITALASLYRHEEDGTYSNAELI